MEKYLIKKNYIKLIIKLILYKNDDTTKNILFIARSF